LATEQESIVSTELECPALDRSADYFQDDSHRHAAAFG